MIEEDKKYLEECFRLAKLGESRTFPNPIVGAVIVEDSEIIGKGFHRCFAEAHAEVNAINDVLEKNPNHNFSQASIYVSLEPCAHHGKTPPCADLIIKHNFKRLIFSSYDPNPQVSGNGIEAIKQAGMEITEPKDLDESIVAESDFLQRSFFSQLQNSNKRPWITVKLAKTLDGRMITRDNEARWISNSESRKRVHRLRSTHQALISTVKTIKEDDALLNVRYRAEDLALHEIRDPDLIIPCRSHNFTKDERQNLKLFTEGIDRKIHELKSENLDSLFTFCRENNYQKLMLEAGPSLVNLFINQGYFDEIIHYQPFAEISADEILKSYGLEAKNYEVRKKRIVADQENDDIEVYITKKL